MESGGTSSGRESPKRPSRLEVLFDVSNDIHVAAPCSLVKAKCVALWPSFTTCIALEYFKADVPLAKALRQRQPTDACTNYQHM